MPKQIALSDLVKLVAALREAAAHLEYCGYGDSWERECAFDRSHGQNLPEQIAEALELFKDV